MLIRTSSYETLAAGFAWRIPERYNIGVDVCDKWADGTNRLALVYEQRDGTVTRYGFDELKALSNQLAHSFARHGVARGERVGIFLPQAPETALAHLAAYKLGAIAVPLFALFGVEALQYRLSNSGAVALVTDTAGLAKIAQIRGSLPELKTVYCIDGDAQVLVAEGALPFWSSLEHEPRTFEPVDTSADDPAVIIYTSGTTGKPKGALHAHRVLLGHLPGVEMSHDLLPQPGDRIWTP